MGSEQRLVPLLEGTALGLKKAEQKHVLSKEGLRALQEPIAILAVAGGLYVALILWNKEIAELLVLTILFGQTVQRLGVLQGYYQNVAKSESAYWSLSDAIKRAQKAVETRSGREFPYLNQGIYFKNVTFKYGNKVVLENITFQIMAKKFTAVVGESGAGKTTIADLIIGILELQSGNIRIDDLSIRDVNIKEWRKMIGYVPQETTLFHESILLNITLGDPVYSSKDVEDALKRAGLSYYIDSLTDGINTIVGERGAKLSGGQRQRIAIARALVRRPKLLILDEPTTALDPKTEKEICKTLKELHEDVTIFAISHQTEIMKAADIVYKIENGVIQIMTDLEDQNGLE
jgi:ATP-binding cassette subfamily C protein